MWYKVQAFCMGNSIIFNLKANDVATAAKEGREVGEKAFEGASTKEVSKVDIQVIVEEVW